MFLWARVEQERISFLTTPSPFQPTFNLKCAVPQELQVTRLLPYTPSPLWRSLQGTSTSPWPFPPCPYHTFQALAGIWSWGKSSDGSGSPSSWREANGFAPNSEAERCTSYLQATPRRMWTRQRATETIRPRKRGLQGKTEGPGVV